MSTLGDTIDQLHQVAEIRACEDCPLCTTIDSMERGLVIICAAAESIELTNGRLSSRPEDCPVIGKTVSWPEGGR